MSLASMLPIACANLRAAPGDKLFASDASSWGEASVVADIPTQVTDQAFFTQVRLDAIAASWTCLCVRFLAPS